MISVKKHHFVSRIRPPGGRESAGTADADGVNSGTISPATDFRHRDKKNPEKNGEGVETVLLRNEFIPLKFAYAKFVFASPYSINIKRETNPFQAFQSVI